jgi:hypothetical protein
MRLLWNGNEPGNRWDAGPYLRFSATSDNFTLATYNRFRRSITVSLVGARPLVWYASKKGFKHNAPLPSAILQFFTKLMSYLLFDETAPHGQPGRCAPARSRSAWSARARAARRRPPRRCCAGAARRARCSWRGDADARGVRRRLGLGVGQAIRWPGGSVAARCHLHAHTAFQGSMPQRA